jgi:hypothetical protein
MEADGYAKAGRPLGAISTLVSLFLLLLVFFIVLFSIARVHRERVNEVVASIDRAFGGWPTRFGMIQPEGWLPVPGRAAIVGDLTRILGGIGRLGTAAGGGAVAEFQLDPAGLFAGGSDDAVLSDASLTAIKPLVVRLTSGLGEQGRVIVILGARVRDAKAESLAKRRLAALAAALYESGWPADAERIDLAEGGAPGLSLRIDAAPAPP